MLEVHLGGDNAIHSAAKRQVWWPVKVNVPQDGGTVKAFEYQALFQLGTDQDLLELAKMTDGEARQKIRDLVLDWKDLVDQNKNPIPCNAQTKAAVLEVPYIALSTIVAWRAACIGAPAKN